MTQLTDTERRILRQLADAFNGSVSLAGKGPTDDVEFCAAIHAAQNLIALRVARRADPDLWAQYEDQP